MNSSKREESSLIKLTFTSFLFFNHHLPNLNLLNNGDVSWLDNNDNIADVQLEAWMFLNIESDKNIFCYVNEMTFGSHTKVGLVARRTNPVPPTNFGGREEGACGGINFQWPMTGQL